MRRVLGAMLFLGLLWSVSSAQAEMAQEFNVGVKNVKRWGAYSLVVSSRTYATGGGIASPINTIRVRFASGVKIRREFLTERYFCDFEKLHESRNPSDCRRSRVGTGKLLIDLRPLFEEQVPASVYLFLAEGVTRRAVASVLVLAVPDKSSSVVKRYPFVADIRPLVRSSIIPDRSAGRRFGYRQDMEMADNLSLPEFRWALSGLTARKRVRRCVKSKRGRCVRKRRRMKKIFWLTRPRCPRSRKLSFEGTYSYSNGQSIARKASVNCSRFGR